MTSDPTTEAAPVVTPYHRDEIATLYPGNALAVLAQLPTASAAALITDPPYSTGGAMRGDRAAADVYAKYVQSDSIAGRDLAAFAGDNRDQRGYGYWCSLWLTEALRVVRPGGVAMLFTDWRQLPVTTDALQAGGWVWRGIVPWAKPTARPQAGRFTAQCEYVVWGSAGAMPIDLTEECLPGFFQAMPPRNREHITQKPVDICRDLVRIAGAGELVIDPFMGAGTTGVAAVIEGRRFLGVEVTEHFQGVARDRIVKAQYGAPRPGVQGVLDFTAEGA